MQKLKTFLSKICIPAKFIVPLYVKFENKENTL